VRRDIVRRRAGPRRASQIVVDGERHRLVLFAGTSGPYFDDLWELPLDGGTWARLPGAPISRGGHAMAIDRARDELWLFGGTRPGSDLDDLWRFDLTADFWEHVTPGCPAGCPTPRSGATLVRDTRGDRMLLYGGWESSTDTYRRETWALTDLGGAPVWTEVVPDGESPQGRFFHVAGYDAEAQRMVIFGGGASGSAYRDAFGLSVPADGSAPRWHTLSPTTPITARDQASVVLDEGLLTAFGGFGSGTFPGTFGAGTHLADTWQRPLGRRAAWRLATPTDEIQVPIAREGAAHALDIAGHRLLLFGGLDGDTTLTDVWVAELARPGRPRWDQLCSPTSCGQGPSARWGAHAIYDARGERFVVFGGLTEDGVTTNDVWSLDLRGTPTWHELTPPGPRPAPRWSAAYGFDPTGRRMVVFGGQTGPDATGVGLQDTWALSLDGDQRWSQLAATGPLPMPRRSAAGAVRVTAERTELIVATGLTVAGSIHHNDVWSLDLSDDAAGWVQLATDAPGAGPTPRRSASAVHDPVTDLLLVAFGRDAQQFFDQTWAFDLTERTWHHLPG
jgi:Galactose oxidase, central domain